MLNNIGLEEIEKMINPQETERYQFPIPLNVR